MKREVIIHLPFERNWKDPKNYTYLIVCNTVCRLYENLEDKLEAEVYKIISEEQSGFRAGHLCG